MVIFSYALRQYFFKIDINFLKKFQSIPDLGAFSVMFMIVFLAYAQVAFLIFGPFVSFKKNIYILDYY